MFTHCSYSLVRRGGVSVHALKLLPREGRRCKCSPFQLLPREERRGNCNGWSIGFSFLTIRSYQVFVVECDLKLPIVFIQLQYY